MSHPTIDQLGPTPRHVPLPVRAHMLFGGVMNQCAWMWIAFSSMFFWGFAMNSEALAWFSFSGPLSTGLGTVTHCETTGASEGGGKHSPGVPIYANHFSFFVKDKEFQGCSYATGTQLAPGMPVTIEYSPANPTVARISNMRSRLFGAGAIFVTLFPLIGIGLLLPGYFLGRKANRLLECGMLAQAVHLKKEPTNTRINNRIVYKLTFEYTAGDNKKYQVSTKTHETAKLEDEASEQILYDPGDPARTILVDALPGAFRVDETGQIQVANSRRALLVTFLPLLTVGGNLAWAILR